MGKGTMEQGKPERLIVCCTPFGDGWTWFVQDLTAPDVRWQFFSDEQRYRWQSWIRKPNLRTPVAGLRTAWAARKDNADLIITIDPRFSLWVALWCWFFYVKTRHMVFTFNFPNLPYGWKRRIFGFAFRSLHMLRVHSSMEIGLYRDFFNIPEERIHLALWAMNPPVVKPLTPLYAGDYLSAVGGNSRDYEALLAACRLTPEIPMVWVVRPENIAHLDLPPNVHAVVNIEPDAAMNYLAFSKATVLPLRSRHTPCGHVTLVAAMYLRRAILATDSAGIADYVKEGINGNLTRPGNVDDLVQGMRAFWLDPARMRRMGEAGLRFAETFCTEALVRKEMYDYLQSVGLARDEAPFTQNLTQPIQEKLQA